MSSIMLIYRCLICNLIIFSLIICVVNNQILKKTHEFLQFLDRWDNDMISLVAKEQKERKNAISFKADETTEGKIR